jgi:hypothetical protein
LGSLGCGAGAAEAVAVDPEPELQSISCSSPVHPLGAPVAQEIAPSLPLIWTIRTEPLFVPETATQARTLSAVTGESVLGEEELEGGGGGGAAVVVVTVTVEVAVTVDVTVDVAGAAVVVAEVLAAPEVVVVPAGGASGRAKADAAVNPAAERASAAANASTRRSRFHCRVVLPPVLVERGSICFRCDCITIRCCGANTNC